MRELTRHIYYEVKPFIPRRVRLALRRLFAKQKRKLSKRIWPIDEAAGHAPEGWSGWPEGKRFAFVLTHDVEGPKGVAQCRQLAELEMSAGFRSSFNFVPEGTYQVTRELRTWLTAHGFEVGIHDLHHNGKLFRNRKQFASDASRINGYVREWKAAGFRAGFMMRNLDWLHQLEVEYDASTFDSDPFEPQPDGAKTIFPFWLPAPKSPALGEALQPNRTGYVELPYTLAQDSTLFLLLQEPSPEIWTRKIDWLVQQGGMALVNIHPDYICFDGKAESSNAYPIEHVIELLTYVRERYTGQYWHALPCEIARHVRNSLST